MFRKTKGQTLRRGLFRVESRGSGQSTVEYVLLVTAVIGVMIFFLTNKNQGLQGKLNSTLGTASNSIGNMTDRLQAGQKESKLGDGINPGHLDVRNGAF